MRITILFLIHILVSITILVLNFLKNDALLSQLTILGIFMFLAGSLIRHYYEVKDLNIDRDAKKKKISIRHIKIILGSGITAAVTWFINHNMGYGAIIANGFVGILVSILFSPEEAGGFYVASFVGMSAKNVMPSAGIAGIAGLLTGIIILSSKEIYAGIGGKGGTMAAFSTQFVRWILNYFI